MIANILTGLVAAFHVYFMYLEMVAWDTPSNHERFRLDAKFATDSKGLAANQGLYNGFLAAGLVWAIYLGEAGFQLKLFFLIFAVVAGLFGGLTVNRKILYFQALPGAVALIAVFLHV